MNIKQIVLVGMFAALLAIISPFQIILPFSPVPITLQIIGVTLAASILGSKLGSLSIIIYIVLGAIGLPIFAGFKSGVPTLVGPTGGYIIGFIVSAYFIGRFIEIKKDLSFFYVFFINIIGLLLVYTIGTIQLSFVYTHSFTKALTVGVIPYIIPDLVKLIFSSILIVQVQAALSKAGYLIRNDPF